MKRPASAMLEPMVKKAKRVGLLAYQRTGDHVWIHPMLEENPGSGWKWSAKAPHCPSPRAPCR